VNFIKDTEIYESVLIGLKNVVQSKTSQGLALSMSEIVKFVAIQCAKTTDTFKPLPNLDFRLPPEILLKTSNS